MKKQPALSSKKRGAIIEPHDPEDEGDVISQAVKQETKSFANLNISGKAQQSLATFFGGVPEKPKEGSEVVLRGPGASLEGFPEGEVIDIWSWNVNGINAVLEKGFLAAFMTKNSPTVLCINETKCDTAKLDKMRYYQRIAPGYAQYWNGSTAKKGYSGTAIFTKVKPLSVQFDFGAKHNKEGRSITMEFKHFILVATYVPNAGEGLKRLDYRINQWDADFHAYLSQLELDRGKPVVLAGDLNVAHHEIDLYDPKGKEKVPGYTP